MAAGPFLEEEIILLDQHQAIRHLLMDRASLRLEQFQGIRKEALLHLQQNLIGGIKQIDLRK
jgi:hypothetical protein